MALNIDLVRSRFPSLAGDWVFFDNAGGSQTAQPVLDRINEYLVTSDLQHGASYDASRLAVERVAEAQRAMATLADVPAIMASRAADPEWGPADPRTASYMEGTHHPQRALPPRVTYMAVEGDSVVGYIAGHLTERYDCDGEGSTCGWRSTIGEAVWRRRCSTCSPAGS